MNFRYFDINGQQITSEQMLSMQIMTPSMEHVLASVMERVLETRRQWNPVENFSLR